MKSAILRTLVADQGYRVILYRTISKKVHLDNKIMIMMTAIVIIYLMFLNCLLILVSILVGFGRTDNAITLILQPGAKIRESIIEHNSRF
jgi:hypothetical protein